MNASRFVARIFDGALLRRRKRLRQERAQSRTSSCSQKKCSAIRRAPTPNACMSISMCSRATTCIARASASTAAPGVALGAAGFPVGETHSDEFFGEQETYRRKFEIVIPYRRSAHGDNSTWSSSCKAVPTSGSAIRRRTGRRPSPSGALFLAAGATARPRPGPVARRQAFVMNARFDKPNELTVAWQIAPGLLPISRQAEFGDGKSTRSADLARTATLTPTTTSATSRCSTTTSNRRSRSPAQAPRKSKSHHRRFPRLQGESICYPPGEQSWRSCCRRRASFPWRPRLRRQRPVSEQDRWAAVIRDGSWSALLGGFILPDCCCRSRPASADGADLSSIIAGQGGTVSAGRGFALSASYVLGMAFTYTSAGTLPAIAGSRSRRPSKSPG